MSKTLQRDLYSGRLRRVGWIAVDMSTTIRICHVAMADLWAGAEVYLVILLRRLRMIPGLSVSAVLFNEGRVADELRRSGITVTIISERANGPIAILIKLYRYFRANPCDFVHTHKPKDSILCALANLCLSQASLVRTLHGAPEPFQGIKYLKMNLYEAIDRLIIKALVSKVILVSLELAHTAEKAWKFERFKCIHNGIELHGLSDPKKGSIKRLELGVGQDEVLVGSVGRLTPVKGHELLICAAHMLLARGWKIKLLLVGDGPLYCALKTLSESLNIEQNTLFVGHQDTVEEFILAMDIFVLPSVHEGIPLALLEAMALRRPVVATQVGGIVEVIDHGVNGKLVLPGDSVALANSVEELIENPSLAAKLARAGQDRIREEFNAEVMAERTAGVYKELMCDK